MLAWRNLTAPLLWLVVLAGCATAVAAQDTPSPQPDVWAGLSGPLLQLLAVVILVESALSALFEWRVYRMAFNARALKTPIMLIFGVLIVSSLGYDPMALILKADSLALGSTGDWPKVLTGALSALIIAGGSSGVYSLFARLGIRGPAVSAEETEARELKQDQAWISIRATGAQVSEPIQIGIEELSVPDTSDIYYFYDHATLPPLAGTIDQRCAWSRARAAFTADAYRFPSYGGRTVAARKHYRITATWQDREGPVSVGIFRGQFDSRAVIDLSVDVSKHA